MTVNYPPVVDRELARYLIRSSDAIDLLMGGMTEALAGRPPQDPMVGAILRAVNELHTGVRAPLLKDFPEFDLDNLR